jgi:hypothetical protein
MLRVQYERVLIDKEVGSIPATTAKALGSRTRAHRTGTTEPKASADAFGGELDQERWCCSRIARRCRVDGP